MLFTRAIPVVRASNSQTSTTLSKEAFSHAWVCLAAKFLVGPGWVFSTILDPHISHIILNIGTNHSVQSNTLRCCWLSVVWCSLLFITSNQNVGYGQSSWFKFNQTCLLFSSNLIEQLAMVKIAKSGNGTRLWSGPILLLRCMFRCVCPPSARYRPPAVRPPAMGPIGSLWTIVCVRGPPEQLYGPQWLMGPPRTTTIRSGTSICSFPSQ